MTFWTSMKSISIFFTGFGKAIDLNKYTKIAPDFRSPSRCRFGRIAGLCNQGGNIEGEGKDQQGWYIYSEKWSKEREQHPLEPEKTADTGRFFRLGGLLILLIFGVSAIHAMPRQHGLALYGKPKYAADFSHFDYVNPAAPKGGKARFAVVGSFDTLNYFIIKGQPAAGLRYLFDTLMTASADEPFSQYGLLAESVELAEDFSRITYHLNPRARFHDGNPVTAGDVKFSFSMLKEKGRPFYRFYYANVDRVEIQEPRTITFYFQEGHNRELPLILGQMPVFSKAWWKTRDFSVTTLTPPMGSGPYRVDTLESGRFINYRRDPDYWAKDLPVNRGMYNFDEIQYDYYRDGTVALEAFKAGQYDIRPESVAKLWVTGYDFPAFHQGRVIKAEIPNKLPSGMQGFVFNLRRPQFQDVRVRQALGLAFDFQWTNRNLFYDQYVRTKSYFDNSELAARGLPSSGELAVLAPLRDQLPKAVFDQVYAPPRAGDTGKLRNNLREALGLLQQAGWVFKDRRLVHGKTGRPFSFEILLNRPTWERIVLPFVRNLERLGIRVTVRVVDSAQYEHRTRHYDYDMIVAIWGQSLSPGNEQRNFWGSKAAKLPGSRNLAGIENPAIDVLIDALIASPDRQTLVARTRALDRVLLWNHYVIPHWHYPCQRIAYWNKFGRPKVIPLQGAVLDAWWWDEQKAENNQ